MDARRRLVFLTCAAIVLAATDAGAGIFIGSRSGYGSTVTITIHHNINGTTTANGKSTTNGNGAGLRATVTRRNGRTNANATVRTAPASPTQGLRLTFTRPATAPSPRISGSAGFRAAR